MRKPPSSGPQAKVFYRPIEAAIQWAGLSRFERRILDVAKGMNRLPEHPELARWPQLRLNAERIYDALLHLDLPYGKNGITSNDPALLDDPSLTIRHVDLKAWMIRFYPDQRPAFLFDVFERHLHPAVSVDAVQALVMDREALKLQLVDRVQAWDALYDIVGGLLTLLLGKSPNGVPIRRSRRWNRSSVCWLPTTATSPGSASERCGRSFRQLSDISPPRTADCKCRRRACTCGDCAGPALHSAKECPA